jgi:hypothetical protein
MKINMCKLGESVHEFPSPSPFSNREKRDIGVEDETGWQEGWKKGKFRDWAKFFDGNELGR